MAEPGSQTDSTDDDLEPVCELWPRFLQAAFGIFVLAISIFTAYHYASPSTKELSVQVAQLTRQVDQLKQEQAMPAMVLNKYRNSICYIYGVYQISYPAEKPELRARISGTGFVVSEGLLATNRHIAEPWYGDAESTALISKGATPHLEKLLAFFPGLVAPVEVSPVAWSAQADAAILRVEDASLAAKLAPLPLAASVASPGELVAVVGYPMGVLGMVAKSPPAVYDRLAYRHDDMGAASELAALSLIRPSATYGHLGDVVGNKLIYDAPTAHGGSGGPVFDSHGDVIGVNAAYIDGFSGGTLGVSVEALRPLITAARSQLPAKPVKSETSSSAATVPVDQFGK